MVAEVGMTVVLSVSTTVEDTSGCATHSIMVLSTTAVITIVGTMTAHLEVITTAEYSEAAEETATIVLMAITAITITEEFSVTTTKIITETAESSAIALVAQEQLHLPATTYSVVQGEATTSTLPQAGLLSALKAVTGHSAEATICQVALLEETLLADHSAIATVHQVVVSTVVHRIQTAEIMAVYSGDTDRQYI